MEAIGIRELKTQGSEILRRVRDEGRSFEVTFRGRVIARLTPTIECEPSRTSDFWREWDQLSQAISDRWPAGVSALDAVREGRRAL